MPHFSNHLFFSKGFTVIELIVSTAVIMVILGIGIFNYQTYNGNVVVDKVANEVILTLREAQVDATSTKELQSGTNDFSGRYGVHFVDNSVLYNTFADLDEDLSYDEAEELQTYAGDVKLSLFYKDTPASALQATSEAVVIFPRLASPFILRDIPGVSATLLTIKISSLNNETERLVCVWRSGRIYITKDIDCGE